MNIIYRDKNIDVDLEVNDYMTMIAGDSASGKTYLFNYLNNVIEEFKNNPYKPSEVECNQDMNKFKFININNKDILPILLNDGNTYIYFIDRGELFIDKSLADLINKSNSTFIVFSRTIDGLMCRFTSYCKLKFMEKDGKYYFINKPLSKRRDGKDFI